MMSARKKLNVGNAQVAVLVALIAGILLNSWIVFVLVLATMVAMAVHKRDIR
jgi:hypothetical protein